MDEIKGFWSLPLPDLFETLSTRQTGLTDDEALSRLKQSDKISEKKTWFNDLILLPSQFKSPE